MSALKLIPHLLSWALLVFVLLRGFSGNRSTPFTAGNAGFIGGAAGALFLSGSANLLFGIIKSALGVGFLLLWVISVVAIYRSTGRGVTILRAERFLTTPFCAGTAALLAGMVAGAVSACKLQGTGNPVLGGFLLVLAAIALSFAVRLLARLVPASFTMSPAGMASGGVALLLFSASSILRLDLFSPLSMKVMKGVHDFVHQFMESILIPDHLFVRPIVWKLIGLLFGKEVGFWGGMVIWFTPAVLISLAIYLQRLPSVAHIRQGAQRRKLLAAAIGKQRVLLVTPLASVAILGAAAYQSSFPTVEYWDPKPIPVAASPAGEIFIPKKGEIDLADGKLHKYLFKQGEREARFFVLMGSSGQLTVDLDACAICKPDGYGQAEGSVICYYCKTLIPLDTVGKPGGCNPVPVQFTERADGVALDAVTLVNSWSATVRATAGAKEGGK